MASCPPSRVGRVPRRGRRLLPGRLLASCTYSTRHGSCCTWGPPTMPSIIGYGCPIKHGGFTTGAPGRAKAMVKAGLALAASFGPAWSIQPVMPGINKVPLSIHEEGVRGFSWRRGERVWPRWMARLTATGEEGRRPRAGPGSRLHEGSLRGVSWWLHVGGIGCTFRCESRRWWCAGNASSPPVRGRGEDQDHAALGSGG